MASPIEHGGDDVFSLAAAEIGLHFGVFPELRITHLIQAGRLSQHYLLRLIHDHALSHGVLAYMLDGIQPERTDFFRYVHLLLHAMRNGPSSMRCQWAAPRDAAHWHLIDNGASSSHGGVVHIPEESVRSWLNAVRRITPKRHVVNVIVNEKKEIVLA